MHQMPLRPPVRRGDQRAFSIVRIFHSDGNFCKLHPASFFGNPISILWLRQAPLRRSVYKIKRSTMEHGVAYEKCT